MSNHKLFRDGNGRIITQNQLLTKWMFLVYVGETDSLSFVDYMENCTSKNGTLTEVTK